MARIWFTLLLLVAGGDWTVSTAQSLLPLRAAELAGCGGRLFALENDFAGAERNQLTTVEADGRIAAALPLGPGARRFSMTADCSRVYVLEEDGSRIRRLVIASGVADLDFRVQGSGGLFTPPGRPELVVVSEAIASVPSARAYRNGTPLPRHAAANASRFLADPAGALIYALDGATSAATLTALRLSDGGLDPAFSEDQMGDGAYPLAWLNGELVFASGRAYDPGANKLSGTYLLPREGDHHTPGAGRGAASDSVRFQVYMLQDDEPQHFWLRVYDGRRRVLLESFELPRAPLGIAVVRPGLVAVATEAGVQLFEPAETPRPASYPPRARDTAGGEPPRAKAAISLEGPYRRISVGARDLAYSRDRRTLYAATSGAAGMLGNSILAIDAASGHIMRQLYVGSEPGPLALTPDNRRLYVGLDGAPEIVRVDLDNFAIDQRLQLDKDPGLGLLRARDLAIPPAGPERLAVALRHDNTTSPAAGLAVFENGRRLPRSIGPADQFWPSTTTFLSQIEFGDSPGLLYAYDNDSTLSAFGLIQIGPEGATPERAEVGWGGDINALLRYSAGRLYVSSGWIIDPALRRPVALLGFLGTGPSDVAPAPDEGSLYYLRWLLDGSTALFSFEHDTLRLKAAVAVPGTSGLTGPSAGSLTRLMPGFLAYRAAGEIVIADVRGLPRGPQAWPRRFQGQTIRSLNLPVLHLVADRAKRRLYAAVDGLAGDLGASIVSIDPQNGQIESATLFGGEAGRLAVSGDGRFLYAADLLSDRIRRFQIPGLIPDLEFSAGRGHYIVWDIPSKARDIASPPGSPDLIALRFPSFLTRFDEGRPRPTVGEARDAYSIATDDSGRRVYAFNSLTNAFAFYRFALDADGLTFLSDSRNLLTDPGSDSDFYVEIVQGGGRVYATNGVVIDPEKLERIGRMEQPGTDNLRFYGSSVLPDPAGNRVFFLASSPQSRRSLQVYDATTLRMTGLLEIPESEGIAADLVRWSDDGLAFRTTTGQLFLVPISAIPPAGN